MPQGLFGSLGYTNGCIMQDGRVMSERESIKCAGANYRQKCSQLATRFFVSNWISSRLALCNDCANNPGIIQVVNFVEMSQEEFIVDSVMHS